MALNTSFISRNVRFCSIIDAITRRGDLVVNLILSELFFCFLILRARLLFHSAPGYALLFLSALASASSLSFYSWFCSDSSFCFCFSFILIQESSCIFFPLLLLLLNHPASASSFCSCSFFLLLPPYLMHPRISICGVFCFYLRFFIVILPPLFLSPFSFSLCFFFIIFFFLEFCFFLILLLPKLCEDKKKKP